MTKDEPAYHIFTQYGIRSTEYDTRTITGNHP